MRHPLASIRTHRVGALRIIRCPLCGYSTSTPARNALATTALLRGRLADHLRERHPEPAAEDATSR